ncbi:MAG: hypothetical protein J5504_05910 [Butyrivibrio sp.]|nr:hypothetical protein [Butyrivibrio sp.]
MKIAAIVLAVLGLITSFAAIGIVPSIAGFALSLMWFLEKKSINSARSLAISVTGILLPVVMYFNSFGFSLPYEKSTGLSFLSQIIYDNYTNLGLDMRGMIKNKEKEPEVEPATDYLKETADDKSIEADSEEYTFVDESQPKTDENKSIDDEYELDIIDIVDDEMHSHEHKPVSTEIGASDDDMSCYGGLPLGTLLIARYFREDDHNCNPVLVLQNKSGDLCRYECKFTARDGAGNQLAVSEKTVEVVQNDAKFVFEGRFDKNELQGKLPTMYEFSITRRKPYEKDRLDDVAVYSKTEGNSVFLAAENTCDKKVKVDAFVLFFDGNELVDCIWLIPGSDSNVFIEPESVGTVSGDAYYKFDRIETYYTAYEAVDSRN